MPSDTRALRWSQLRKSGKDIVVDAASTDGNQEFVEGHEPRIVFWSRNTTVGFTAIMRKLILLANALIKQDRMWTKIKV